MKRKSQKQGSWLKLIKQTKINNPEYAYSRQRLDALQKIVLDGEQAETIEEYVNTLVETVERETLEAMLRNDSDIERQRMFYQAAVRLAQLVKDAISQGKQKESILISLRK